MPTTAGDHWCANLVVAPSGLGAAVLLRAVRITEGADPASIRRGRLDHRKLSDGPGKLCQALAIDGSPTVSECGDRRSGSALEP